MMCCPRPTVLQCLDCIEQCLLWLLFIVVDDYLVMPPRNSKDIQRKTTAEIDGMQLLEYFPNLGKYSKYLNIKLIESFTIVGTTAFDTCIFSLMALRSKSAFQPFITRKSSS